MTRTGIDDRAGTIDNAVSPRWGGRAVECAGLENRLKSHNTSLAVASAKSLSQHYPREDFRQAVAALTNLGSGSAQFRIIHTTIMRLSDRWPRPLPVMVTNASEQW